MTNKRQSLEEEINALVERYLRTDMKAGTFMQKMGGLQKRLRNKIVEEKKREQEKCEDRPAMAQRESGLTTSDSPSAG